MNLSPTALTARHTSLKIDGVQILSDVTLDLRVGELVALIGPNGAGKTSFVNVLSGAQRATGGAVGLHGSDVTRWSVNRRARAGLGRTFQTSNLLLGRSVEENVRLAAAARLGWRAALRAVRPDSFATTHAGELLDQVGLAHMARRPASDLSHGDRRKLELAIVLAQGSSVVLLDEPMAGVNTEDVGPLVDLIRKVHKERNISILMVEHHMHVVLDLADRIAVLHHGGLLAMGTPDEVMADETVQTAYVGEPL